MAREIAASKRTPTPCCASDALSFRQPLWLVVLSISVHACIRLCAYVRSTEVPVVTALVDDGLVEDHDLVLSEILPLDDHARVHETLWVCSYSHSIVPGGLLVMS